MTSLLSGGFGQLLRLYPSACQLDIANLGPELEPAKQAYFVDSAGMGSGQVASAVGSISRLDQGADILEQGGWKTR